MKKQQIQTSLTLIMGGLIQIAFSVSATSTSALGASPQNVEHLPSVTLNKTPMTTFTDANSSISFSYPEGWRESKTTDKDDIVKLEGQLNNNENGEIKLARFNADKISPELAKKMVHEFIFTKLAEFKTLQERKVGLGPSRRIVADLEDVEFTMSGIKIRQRYVYFSTASGTYHFLFTSPASHFDAMVPLYNNVLLSVQVGTSSTSKSKSASTAARSQAASVAQKRYESAQLPFSFSCPGSWKVEPTGNRDEVFHLIGQGLNGEPAHILVHQGDIQPDWSLEQIADSLEKEFFEPQPKFRRLSKEVKDFGANSKVHGVLEEHTYELNGSPVKQMVAIFTNTGKAYALSLLTVGWKDGDTRQLFAQTLAGIKLKD